MAFITDEFCSFFAIVWAKAVYLVGVIFIHSPLLISLKEDSSAGFQVETVCFIIPTDFSMELSSGLRVFSTEFSYVGLSFTLSPHLSYDSHYYPAGKSKLTVNCPHNCRIHFSLLYFSAIFLQYCLQPEQLVQHWIM